MPLDKESESGRVLLDLLEEEVRELLHENATDNSPLKIAGDEGIAELLPYLRLDNAEGAFVRHNGAGWRGSITLRNAPDGTQDAMVDCTGEDGKTFDEAMEDLRQMVVVLIANQTTQSAETALLEETVKFDMAGLVFTVTPEQVRLGAAISSDTGMSSAEIAAALYIKMTEDFPDGAPDVTRFAALDEHRQQMYQGLVSALAASGMRALVSFDEAKEWALSL